MSDGYVKNTAYTATSNGLTTSKPARAGQVSEWTEYLRKAVDDYEELISELYEALTPVLRQDPIGCNDAKVAEEELVGLANGLRRECRRTRNNNQRLREILEQLEL